VNRLNGILDVRPGGTYPAVARVDWYVENGEERTLPTEINYCDACGNIIRPSAIEQGSAVVNSATMLCGECLRKLPPDEREAMSALRAGGGAPAATPTTASARAASGRRRPRESESRRLAAPAGGTEARTGGPVVKAVAVGLGAAVVSALVAMHL
jgi:hypothetical protein